MESARGWMQTKMTQPTVTLFIFLASFFFCRVLLYHYHHSFFLLLQSSALFYNSCFSLLFFFFYSFFVVVFPLKIPQGLKSCETTVLRVIQLGDINSLSAPMYLTRTLHLFLRLLINVKLIFINSPVVVFTSVATCKNHGESPRISFGLELERHPAIPEDRPQHHRTYKNP